MEQIFISPQCTIGITLLFQGILKVDHRCEDCIIWCSRIGKYRGKNCGGRMEVAIHKFTSCCYKSCSFSCIALLEKWLTIHRKWSELIVLVIVAIHWWCLPLQQQIFLQIPLLQQLTALQISLDQPRQLIHTIFCGWSTASPKEECMKISRINSSKKQGIK